MSKHPGLKVEYAFRESLGDKNQHDPLWKMPERGVFTEDFVEDLETGRCDLVVHSWKDLPVAERVGTEIIATLPRADVRDLLLLKPARFEDVRAGRAPFEILSSSPRRAYNLASALPRLLPGVSERSPDFRSIRGNIPTRLEKFLGDDAAVGLVLAKAALDRLLTAPEGEFAELQARLRASLRGLRFVVLPVALDPPAAAQGALAVEAKRGRAELRALWDGLHCADTFECVQEERRILASHGGGCHQKIGVHVAKLRGHRFEVLKGLTEAGVRLDERRLERKISFEAPTGWSEVFPRPDERSGFGFERRPLEAPKAGEAEALYVSKAEAWRPELASAEQVVWTAGLETWTKLVARGVFVSGSDEGLGERLPLLPWRPELAWRKLSHAEAPSRSELPLRATYSLLPVGTVPELASRRFFFWASASLFERARAANPTLAARGVHACGPGHTADALAAAGVSADRLWICLGYEDWSKELGLEADSRRETASVP